MGLKKSLSKINRKRKKVTKKVTNVLEDVVKKPFEEAERLGKSVESEIKRFGRSAEDELKRAGRNVSRPFEDFNEGLDKGFRAAGDSLETLLDLTGTVGSGIGSQSETALTSGIGLVAPAPDDIARRVALQRRLAKRRRTGRASTLISDRGSKLG